MKYVYFALCILFIMFTYVQFNDDTGTLIWILSYAGIAAIFALAFTGRFFRLITLGAMLACVGGILYLTPGFIEFLTNDDGIGFSQTMSNEYPYIEEAREWGGLLIALLSLGFLFWQIEKNRRKKTVSESETVA